MHLQMQRDVWLDNVINLRQYILWYIDAYPGLLHNFAFHWLTSEYMQMANGFMKLATAGRRHNKVPFHCHFKGKMLIVH